MQNYLVTVWTALCAYRLLAGAFQIRRCSFCLCNAGPVFAVLPCEDVRKICDRTLGTPSTADISRRITTTRNNNKACKNKPLRFSIIRQSYRLSSWERQGEAVVVSGDGRNPEGETKAGTDSPGDRTDFGRDFTVAGVSDHGSSLHAIGSKRKISSTRCLGRAGTTKICENRMSLKSHVSPLTVGKAVPPSTRSSRCLCLCRFRFSFRWETGWLDWFRRKHRGLPGGRWGPVRNRFRRTDRRCPRKGWSRHPAPIRGCLRPSGRPAT